MIQRKYALRTFSILLVFSMILVIFMGNRAITVISEGLPIKRTNCIIIDAGHGGVDGGATSCTGKLESGLNLEIALRLNDLFHLLGYETRMIRTTDISIHTKGETIAQKKVSDLKERVRICNDTENAILLSIHQNNFTDSRYSGAQVFYSNQDESRQLAENLQTNFRGTLNPGSKRQVKKGNGIYLLEHITCPGILIECGFLSNHEEEAKLRNPDYQQKLCCVIVSGVTNFLDG